MYETGRHSFLRSANSVLECRRRCLSSESCNLYLFFSMGSLSRADWKQQLDSAGESHQPPNGRFEQRKAEAKRSRKVEWTGKTYTCTFCGCISGHVYLLRLVAGGCFMHFICWRQAATFWSTVVQWSRMWALMHFNTDLLVHLPHGWKALIVLTALSAKTSNSMKLHWLSGITQVWWQ